MKRLTRFPIAPLALSLGFCLALGTLLPHPVFGQDPAEAPWLRIDTDHFTFFAQTPEGVARSTAYDLEQMRYGLLQLWPETRFDPPVPTLIYLFADEPSFRPYRLNGQAGAASGPVPMEEVGGTAGYLVPHEHGTYAALIMDAESRRVEFVYKQYILHLLHVKLPALPLWLRHGLAEYYSTFEIDGGTALLGRPVLAHRNALITLFHGSDRFPLAGLLDARDLPNDPAEASTFLRLSWALVHYLKSDPTMSRQLATYAVTAADRDTTQQALAQSFDFDLATLEERLATYVRGTRFNYSKVPIDRGTHPAKVRQLAPHETFYTLGDLLVHANPNRRDEAGNHFRRAKALAPGYLLPEAGLGYLAELAGDETAALGHYQQAGKATQGGDGQGGDFIAQYLYGSSLVRSLGNRRPATEEEEARLQAGAEALERCLQQWPDFAPAWARLGYARNLQPEGSTAAVEALENAYGLTPGRFDVAFNLLLAYARIDNREAVDSLVGRMRSLGADPTTLQRANEVQLTMDYRQAGRLVREKRLDDAIAEFARIRAESLDPKLQQQAADQLAKFESTAQALRFSELYQEAATRLAARQLDSAEALIRQLAENAKPGKQRETVTKMQHAAEALRQSE